MTREVSQARLERVIGRLFDEITATQQGLASVKRAQDSRHTTLEPGALLQVLGEDGRVKMSLGDDGSGDPIKYVDGPTPNQPEAPEVDTQHGSITVVVDGFDVDGDLAPADLAHVRVHYSRDAGFEPYAGSYKGQIGKAKGQTTFGVSAGLWYVAVQWESKSGKLSEPSEIVTVDVEAPVDRDEIQQVIDDTEQMLDDFEENVATPRFERLETGLAENEQNLSDARDRLTSAEKTLAPLPGQMTETHEQATEAREAAEAAEARAVEANNRSMTRLANGNFENGLLYWDVSDVDISGDAHSGTQSALIGSGGSISPASSMPVVEGQIWELSLYHKTNGGGTFNIRMESVTEDGTRTIFEEWSIQSAGWADTGALRATIPADVDLMSFTVTGDGTRVDDITLRDVTDVVRLEEAARSARKKAETVEETIEGAGGIRERLGTAEQTIRDKADSARIDEIDDQVETALTGPVTHDRLRAGEGAFDSAFVDELWVRNVRALAAELASLIVASANMVPNGDLTQGDQFWRLDNAEIVEDDTPPGHKYAIRREPNDGVVRNETSFPVQGGEEYLFEMWIKADKPNSSFYWDMRDQDGVHVGQDGGTTENLEPEGYAHSSTWRPVSDLTVPTEWTRVRTILRPSESVDSLRLATTYFNHANGTERDATVWIAGVRVAPRAGAEVIVDGTIGTRHLNVTGEMTAAIVNADKSKVIELIAEDLIAQNATLINTAMQNLSVTQRADFAKAYAQELWAELGVFDKLQAAEAWIGGAMFEDGAVHARHLTVTEDFIAKIAQFIEVWADTFWANQAFIDRMAASEAYFGSEDADQQTRVDGQGVTSYRRNEQGELIPAIELGGGEFGLNFWNENGDQTGVVTSTGEASFQTVAADDYTYQGARFFGKIIPDGTQPIFDTLTNAFAARNERTLGASHGANETDYGFLPLSFQAIEGVTYEIIVPPIPLWTINPTPRYTSWIRYTTDGTSPIISSSILHEDIAEMVAGANQAVAGGFTALYPAEHTGTVRLLLGVSSPSEVSRWFHVNRHVSMWVRPAGVTPEPSGEVRDVTFNHPDLADGVEKRWTAWSPMWSQSYENGRHRAWPNLLYGYEKDGTMYASQVGGYRSGTAIAGSDKSMTIDQALAGAQRLTYGTLSLRGLTTPTNNRAAVRVYRHDNRTPDGSLPVNTAPSAYVGTLSVLGGSTAELVLDRDTLDAIENNRLRGFTFHPVGTTNLYIGLAPHDATAVTTRPLLRLEYIR